MPNQLTISNIHLSDEITTAVDSLSTQTGRSATDIVTDAVETYLRNQGRWQQEMEAALREVDSGQVFAGDEVLEWMKSWGTDAEKPRPTTLVKS